MTKPHALVAGAGIGGLTAALCLARIGWRVTLLERAPLLEEVGAGLQLSPNASRILKDLGVLARLEGAALTPSAIRIRRGRDAALLALLPLDKAEQTWGAPYCVALRSDLQRALLEAVACVPEICLVAGTTVAGFAATSEGVTVAAKQGLMRLSFEGTCLIGADGVQSFVRKRLLEPTKDALRFSGNEAWRALVPADQVAPDMLRPETNLWLGPDAHVVHYPLRGGTIVNLAVILGKARAPKMQADVWSNAGDPQIIAARFSKWHPALRGLIASAPEWLTWPLFEHDPLSAWTAGPIALLGDAAHPMLPFLAQGAAQAIEDAAALASALTKYPAVDIALSTYAAARLAHTAKVQKASHQQGMIYHLAGPAAAARDLTIRALGPRRMLARNDWIYRGSQRLPASKALASF
jgi:salicylate hydroxylase